MTPKERGDLVELLRACYKCTSWQHQGENCYTRGRSNCNVVTAGSACGGVHHKSLHGSGVAFCHKMQVKVASIDANYKDNTDDCSTSPDINQPVLLEVQAFEVHGTITKVMFDNGSSAALVTHLYAEKTGLIGRKVSYWLSVVGHEPVLR